MSYKYPDIQIGSVSYSLNDAHKGSMEDFACFATLPAINNSEFVTAIIYSYDGRMAGNIDAIVIGKIDSITKTWIWSKALPREFIDLVDEYDGEFQETVHLKYFDREIVSLEFANQETGESAVLHFNCMTGVDTIII